MSTEIEPAIEPFDHYIDGEPYRVNVMDKDNPRYYFYHPFLKTPEGRRAKISKYTKPEIIEQLELACKDMTVKLTRSGYEALAGARTCVRRIRGELEAHDASPEQIVAGVKRHIENISNEEEQPGAPVPKSDEEAPKGGPPVPSPRVDTPPAAPGNPEPPPGVVEGPLTYRQLAFMVLKACGPLGSSEIWQKALEMGLAERVVSSGNSPEASLRSRLDREVRTGDSPFYRINGEFALKEGAEAPQTGPKLIKFKRKTPIPDPPRKPNGKIDWKSITTELLQKLADEGPLADLAAAWEVSTSVVYKYCHNRGVKTSSDWNVRAAQQRKEELAPLVAANPKGEQLPARQMPWQESAAKFLRLLWTAGMAQIARDCHCAPCTVRFHADRLKLARPKAGFLLQKAPKIPEEISEQIKVLELEEAKVAEAEQAARDAGAAI